jgi:hypothetical protein
MPGGLAIMDAKDEGGAAEAGLRRLIGKCLGLDSDDRWLVHW